MTITCSGCGSENDARRLFCNHCGVSLEVCCPCCGFSNRVGDRFCGGCGVRLAEVGAKAAQPVAEEAPAPASLEQAKRDELRTITVMMADLDGFAEMTDVHGRERQTQVMNEVFERLAQQHIVEAFDGYIDKFLDGDIMALFGAPVAHEDAPERAVRAAVRMHHELARLHEDGTIPTDTPLRLRIGLNTGPVRVGGVGAGGRMEYTAMGDTVNLSARLMTACQWGGSLISVNTHRRVAPSFELEELQPVKVKGKSEPVPIWLVTAEKRRAARVEIAEAEGMSRMVGRDELLEQAFKAWTLTEGGEGQVIGIRGEAGIGKSRLVWELRQRLDQDEAQFLEGRCLSYGVNLSFLPLREVLGELCELEDADSEEVRRKKIGALLNGLELDVELHGPPLAWVMGVDFGSREFEQLDPQELNARLRDTVFTVFRAQSLRRPVVLFLDDLQWMDSSSRQILDEVVGRCTDSRLLLVLAFRPDFAHDYEQHPHYTAVTPQRLGVEETREVVGSLLLQRGFIADEAKIDSSLAEAVFNKSQGNPFFIDQTVTALVERAEQSGRPTIDFRRGRLLISVEELGNLVPDSVEEILLSRIDKLPEAPRSLLQAASVAMIGRYFRRSALEFCLGAEQLQRLDEMLDLLQERELIKLANQSPQDTEYTFEHALARDVAYNNLLRAERRRLHGQVGLYIEDHYAASLGAYIDDLAYHYYNSSEAAKALVYLPQSASRAARSYANQNAILHYKRALEKAEEIGRDGGFENLPEVTLEVLKGLTGVQSLVGDKEGLEFGQRRLDLARELDDRDAVIDASYMLAHQHTALGNFDEAGTYWRQVRSEYEASGSWDGVRDSEYGMGNLCYLQGHYEAALDHFQKALEIQVEKMEFEPFSLWVAHNNLAAAYEGMGRYAKILEECAICSELLEELPEDDPMQMRLECYTSGNLGSAHRNLGNLVEARKAYQRTLEITQQTGEKGVEAEVRHWLGRTLTVMGRLEEARQHLDESVALARETGSSRWEAGSLAALAEVHMLCAELDRAGALLAEADQVVERAGDLAGRGDLGIAHGRLDLWRGEPKAAAQRLGEVLEAARGDHSEPEMARALSELSAAEAELGRAEQAMAHCGEALEICATLGLKPAQAWVLRVRALLRAAEPEAALRDVDESLAVAAAMGAPEHLTAALAVRAGLRLAGDPAGAAADLAEAERVLADIRPAAGDGYVAAARARHLAPVAARLGTS